MCLEVDQSLKGEDDEVVMTLKTKPKNNNRKRKDHQEAVIGDAISWFVWYLSCLFMSFCEMESPCVFKRLEGINR